MRSGGKSFPKALEDLHRRETPYPADKRRPPRLDRADDQAVEVEGSGFFERPEVLVYRFGVPHDAEGYLRLLGTFSSHGALEEAIRQRLFAAVVRLMEKGYGGRVVEGYRSELYVAAGADVGRRPCGASFAEGPFHVLG